ncbi:WD repeat-containing protein 79 [Sarocladium strictum]
MATDSGNDQCAASRPTLRLLAESPIQNCANEDTGGSYFSSAQWTADGTCLLATSSEQGVSTFVLPTDLLDQRDQPQNLSPDASIQLPEPTQAIAAAPYFSLAEPSSQLFLAACRDHPLQIRHARSEDSHAAPLAIYKLIKTETEAYIAPSSLLWEHPGTHFICGSMNRLDYFDVQRSGSDGPFLTIPTGPSRANRSKGYSIGMKGYISALASTKPDQQGCSILAAGTRTRWIGMYDIHRTDKAIANWAISGKDGLSTDMDTEGRGVVQLKWSPCGRYLVVNERHANGLLVYDIRGSGRLLGVLGGRSLSTQQRLSCDVFAGDTNDDTAFEVWAGCEDGSVKVWDHVGRHEGFAEPSWDWKAHGSPVSGTMLHSSGSVLATCSGAWGYPNDVESDDTPKAKVLEESSLKLWAIS